MGHKGTVEVLISYGADVNVANSAGKTPLALSASFGRDNQVSELLRSYGGL